MDKTCNHDARLRGEFNSFEGCYACELERVRSIADEAKRLLSVVPITSMGAFYREIADAYRVLSQLEKVE